MVENDYMMRIIHEMVRTLIMLIFHKDQETEEELIFLDGVNQDFYQRLRQLSDEGKINEAENMLYQSLEENEGDREGTMENLKVSLAFYDHLNSKSNDFLEAHNYSREEVEEGILSVMKLYGYGELAETLLENR